MAKLPDPPPLADLTTHSPDLHQLSTTRVLWRIHNTTGAHVTAWNALRHYGPIASCRFDPHDPPPREQPTIGVSYLAASVPTALAERFQQTRIINTRRGAPYLTAFTMTRPLQLLDLTHGWPLTAGASHTINTGPKHRTRAWARAFLAAWPDLDGLLSQSALTGSPCITLFSPTTNALPVTPLFSEPLDHPGLAQPLAHAAQSIGYRTII